MNIPNFQEFEQFRLAKEQAEAKRRADYEAEEKAKRVAENKRKCEQVLIAVERALMRGELVIYDKYINNDVIKLVNHELEETGWSIREGREDVAAYPDVCENEYIIEHSSHIQRPE